jgi:hypothetical protein
MRSSASIPQFRLNSPRAGAAWEEGRNEREVGVIRRFTTADPRVKLHSLYPSIKE